MRLIDADALSDKVFMANCGLPDCGRESCERCCIEPVMKFIKDAPTVDPIKHGHWITWFENKDVRQAKCSECGMMFTLGKGRDIHYCGNCGAKMDEVEDVKE